MPNLPQYNAKQNVNATTVAPLQQQDPLRDEAAQPFKDQQKIVTALTDMTQKWSDANDVMQYTNSKASYETTVARIHAAAEADPGVTTDKNGNLVYSNNSEKYISQLEDARKNATSGISNSMVAQKASVDFTSTGRVTGIKIGASFAKKQLEFNKSQVDTVLIAEQAKIVTGSKNEVMMAQENINNFLNAQVLSGVLSPEEASKKYADALVGTAESQIYNNTDKAISDLKEKDGIYKNIPMDKRQLLIKTGQDYKKRLEKEATDLQKEVSFNTEADIVMQVAQGGQIPSATKMAEMVRAGTMDADFAESALKAVTSPDALDARKDGGEEFANLTQEVLKATDKEQLRKAIKNILKGGGDGKISKPDMQILMQSAIAQGKKPLLEKRTAESNAVTSLGEWADNSKMPRDQVFREFQKNIAAGKTLDEAATIAKKITINANIPGASLMEDAPHAVISKDNKVRYIFSQNTNISAHKIYQENKAK